MDNCCALMLAKRNSTRLPGKNFLLIDGKPMYKVNLEKCRDIFDEVLVSSDDPDVADVLRDEELCGDVPNIPVYRHAMEHTDADAFIAVQANSPTIEKNLIILAKKILEMGVQEVMTCHPDRSLYGSIWGMTRERLEQYGDPYTPTPEVLIVDPSIDIHTLKDYEQALDYFGNRA